jgi:hypothetical protein
VAKANSLEKQSIELRDKVAALTSERDRLAAEKESISVDRDRHAAEKSDALIKAQSIGKERDELRDRLAALTSERDRLAAEKIAVDQIAANSGAECARLRHQLENLPPPDPAKVLFDFASDQTNAAIGKARSLIPPESPALGWFDKTVAIVTEVGCLAVQAIRAFLRWLIPHLRGHYAYVKGKIETQLAKKQ